MSALLFDTGLSSLGEMEVWKSANNVGDYGLSKRMLHDAECIRLSCQQSPRKATAHGVCSWV